MSHLCETYERTIGTVTLETRVYEDGYIQATLIDEFGLELASMDGNSGESDEFDTRGLIEDFLLDQHL